MDTELKRIRLEHHDTQKKLATGVGIDVKTLRRYECGKQTPPLETAYRLAAYYNVFVHELFPPASILPELTKGAQPL